jgi:exonuclease SbcD
MRILSTGDNHFYERSRFDECITVHEWTVETARRERVDAILYTGDMYESASTPTERQAVAEHLTRAAEVAPCLIVKGNHDRELDVELMRRLKTRHPITVESRAAVHHIAGAAVGAFAWPDRAQLVATLGGAAPAQAVDDLARQAFQNVLRGFGYELAQHDGPRILIGHAMIDGSIASTGQPLLGMPLNLGLADLALAQPHLGIYGHIHKHQRWEYDGVPHIYAGSNYRTDFGQLEPKVVLLAEFDGQRLVQVLPIETPATPMVHVDAMWDAGACTFAYVVEAGGTIAGAEVRVQYECEADQRALAKAEEGALKRVLLDAGAKAVKVESSTMAHTMARAPEIALATTDAEKLRALWKVRGTTPDEARVARLLSKQAELGMKVAS